MAIDDPISLSELLEVPDLHDVLASFASMHEVGLSLVECSLTRRVLATTAADQSMVSGALCGSREPEAVPAAGDGSIFLVPLLHQGELLATLAVGPYGPGSQASPGASPAAMDHARAEAIGRHVVGVLEILVHNAYARWLTSTMHTEAMEVNFAELSAKNTRLERAVERMQEVDRLKSSFLATMSHELRTPLTSVIGYSEMLLEGMAGSINDEQREYIRTILNKADQLLQLISAVLDVSMLESGAIELKREPVAMRQLIESVLAGFGQLLRSRRVTITEAGEPMPRALGDSRQIRQMLRNLLANAIKFTPDGGRIDVSIAIGHLQPDEMMSDNRCGIRVIITDSGIGISPDKQSQIFEPFFQVDSSSTRAYGGSGLGLTLAKRYAEAHGGHIWVDSALGSGSVFTVSLPAISEELEAFLQQQGEAGEWQGRAASAAPRADPSK